MFDLDAAEKLPDYEIKYQNKTYSFDTIIVVSSFAKDLPGVTDPAAIRDKVNAVFGLPFTTTQALQVLHDFEQFSDKFEDLLKNLFGRTPSSSTTTDSDLESVNDSLPDSVTA